MHLRCLRGRTGKQGEGSWARESEVGALVGRWVTSVCVYRPAAYESIRSSVVRWERSRRGQQGLHRCICTPHLCQVDRRVGKKARSMLGLLKLWLKAVSPAHEPCWAEEPRTLNE